MEIGQLVQQIQAVEGLQKQWKVNRFFCLYLKISICEFRHNFAWSHHIYDVCNNAIFMIFFIILSIFQILAPAQSTSINNETCGTYMYSVTEVQKKFIKKKKERYKLIAKISVMTESEIRIWSDTLYMHEGTNWQPCCFFMLAWVCQMVCQRCVSAWYTKWIRKLRCLIGSIIFLKWCILIQNIYASIFHKMYVTFTDWGCIMVLKSNMHIKTLTHHSRGQ